MKTLTKFLYQHKSILLPLLLLAIFISVVIVKAPFKDAFEYNPDEGFDLMKAKLFLNGFPLYKAIWSDQPPLFTVLLSWWFKLFGCSVYHARILVLLSSATLLFAFYQIVKIQWGNLCASTAVLFLLLSASYFKLSVSLMIGIPALSLAMLSIYGIILFKKLRFKPLLILSGVLMALSLQTKFFTAFLIPIIILEIAYQRSFSLILIWVGSAIATYLGITALFFHSDFSMFYQQLFQPHLTKILPNKNFLVIWKIILPDFDIALLALIGIVLLLKQRAWDLILPVLWLLLAFVIILIHRPIWRHYYLLISIPICWLAAISLREYFYGNIKQSHFSLCLRWFSLCLIILTILRLPVKYNIIIESIENKTTVGEHTAIELMSKYKRDNRWVFTNRPIFAFYADMLVPPELAVFSKKRIQGILSGNLQPDYIINILAKYKPGIILLDRFSNLDLKILPFVKNNYSAIYNYKSTPYPKTFSPQSFSMASYQNKNPLIKMFRYAFFRYKLKTFKDKNIRRYKRNKHNFSDLTLYLRKDLLSSD